VWVLEFVKGLLCSGEALREQGHGTGSMGSEPARGEGKFERVGSLEVLPVFFGKLNKEVIHPLDF